MSRKVLLRAVGAWAEGGEEAKGARTAFPEGSVNNQAWHKARAAPTAGWTL